MKKNNFLIIVITIITATISNAQNIFPISGNVGIGTTAVDTQGWNRVLDLYQDYNARLIVRSSIIKTGIFSHNGWSGQVGRVGTESNHDLRLMAGYNNDVMTLNTAGNVGIGTTAVDTQGWNRVLDLYQDYNARLIVRSSIIKTGIFSHNGWSGQVGRVGTESNHDLRLMAGYNNDVMTLNTVGNVGIGTTTPTAKLTVEGKILASSIRVAVPGSANWSDYVFAPEYKLQPLEQVEAFIKENKHLPKVPSAEQMVKEGNDLGATDAKLLEKIEELTLYLIEMKKEIETLKCNQKN